MSSLTQPSDARRIILIGRHVPDFGDVPIQVVEQRNFTFPATAHSCVPVLQQLIEAARTVQAGLLFQAVPAQVAAALMLLPVHLPVPVGFLISKPGPRGAGLTRVLTLSSAAEANTVAEALRFVNPNVGLHQLEAHLHITVDPPMVFEFSHIEWLHNRAAQIGGMSAT